MLKSLRYRLLAWFLAFVFITFSLVVPATYLYHAREKGIGQVVHSLNNLYTGFLKDTRATHSFLSHTPDDKDFFQTGRNNSLSFHLKAAEDLPLEIEKLKELRYSGAFGLESGLKDLSQMLVHRNQIFDSLVYLVYKRGHRNFGLEGELNSYGNLLETTSGFPFREVYQLRKIEREYITGPDELLADSFYRQAGRLAAALPQTERYSGLIDLYTQAFGRLVELEKRSGIEKNLALRAGLTDADTQIEAMLASLIQKSLSTQPGLIRQLNLFYGGLLVLIVSLSVLFSYLTARRIVSHLEALTNYISVLAKNYQEAPAGIDLHNSAHEIRQIYREFRNLISQLKIWERQRDKALRHAEDNQQRYRELADMLPQGIFETNAMGNYTYVNKAWYKAFGYGPEDLAEGLNLIETLITESSQNDLMGQNKIENSAFMAIRKDGSRFPASVYTDTIIKEGESTGRRGIVIDITERVDYIRSLQQETSKAKTSDELKSSFLANMSHEIRTPMNSIIGFSNLLASEQIPDAQKKDFVHYIRTSSEVLLNLVDDIIDIAKIEAGELKIIKKECDLPALANELLNTARELQKKFGKTHLEMAFKGDPHYPALVLKTDPFRLRQILVNLISNAIKFTDKGSVEFGFEVRDEKTISFSVKDTGIGLSRSELDLIFERFKRSRRSEEKNIVGTGLGLAISKNLVQLLGGEMWVDSQMGAGTTFTFTLPLLRLSHTEETREETQTGYASFRFGGKTILIAEDDENSFSYLAEILRHTEAITLRAQSGEKALEICRLQKVDLVLMDIQLPVMNGLEATRQIKKIDRSIPVIAQTAFAMSGDNERMKAAGCDDYISKPVDSRVLLPMIHKYIHSQPSRKAGVPSNHPVGKST